MSTIPNNRDFTDAIAQIIAIVSSKNVLMDSADTDQYVTDWTGQYKSHALAVILPADTAEVAKLVTICATHNIAIVPQGGRTGLCGGGVPVADQPSVIVSLARMNKIRLLDSSARTIVAEAGVVLENLHARSLEQGLTFPLMFGAKGSCTLGGNLSTNAGGSNVVRYGNTRELCLGIEAVMPDGSIINSLTGLRKDNTGYDLKDLLIGAEGTLGIITAAVFKLFPTPLARTTAFLSVASIDSAITVLNTIQDQTEGAVEAFEYMPQVVVDVICKAFSDITPPLSQSAGTGILLEVASSSDFGAEPLEDGSNRLHNETLTVLGNLMESGLVLDAMVAQSESQRDQLWRMRECTLEALIKSGPMYCLDISLPLSKISLFIDKMDPVCAQLGFQPLTIGHLGDGNLHYALTAKEGNDWASLPLTIAQERAFAILHELNGSFSAEHGIGQSKLTVMKNLKEPSQLAVMRTIKNALDPKNTMNPGKLIPE